MSTELHRIAPWGKSLEEYRRMFALSDEDLELKLLECGDGSSSFNAEMAALGYAVVSIDSVHLLPREQIKERVAQNYAGVISRIKRGRDEYRWEYFDDPRELRRNRLVTMEIFLEDLDRGVAEGRYVREKLPSLSFDEGLFDLALCSHLLFANSDRLSSRFHIQLTRELCRVAKEVRIFPLLSFEGRPSPFVADVQSRLAAQGHRVELVTVPYEFQRFGNQMMRITK
ncbi:MAG TPA: hypothetical protein VFX96_08935 [Pyrinomonadaceae bacterium]|nr:hypothetical protein [Pyrinomonadaceae bacterium]